MIADFFISLFVAVVNFFLSILPAWDTTSHLLNDPQSPISVFDPATGAGINGNAMYALIAQAAKINAFLPVDHFFAIIGLATVVFVVVTLYKVARFVLGTIRGAGTS